MEKEKEEEEIERKRLEKVKDEKLRQKLRRESTELREVAAKLECAYVNKVSFFKFSILIQHLILTVICKVRLGQIAEREATRKAQLEQAEEDR